MRRLRILIEIFSLLVILAYGLDIHAIIPDQAARWLLWFQFTPSALNLSQGALVAGLGALAVLALTWTWGRAYCSFLCPLGALFDCISWLKRKRRFAFKPANPIRYAFLAIALLPILAGSLLTVSLLDPYANFGRLSAELFRPIAIFINNSLVFMMESLGSYALPPIPYRGYAWPVLAFILSYAAIIIYLAWRGGRTYCNLICPLGVMLGIITKLGFKKFHISENCSGCTRCAQVCKASCIDLHKQEVDMSRCVVCFNCTEVCPEEAVFFDRRRVNYNKKRTPEVAERRSFIMNTFALPALIFFKREKHPDTLSIIPTGRKSPILPPGAVSISQYTARCTGCHTCVPRCPSQVLQPSLLGLGKGNPLLPHLNPEFGFCNYDCNRCGDACPNGAILPLSLEDKKVTRIGKVKLEINNCIVRTRKTDCGACAEHCPTKAVAMQTRGKLKEPVINPETCIGCGACEFICPSRPYRAIWVEGNMEHTKAKKPEFGTLKIPTDNNDFPF